MKKKSVMARFIYLSFTICLLISVVLTGCTKSGNKVTEAPKDTASSGPKQGGTLKLIVNDNTTNLGYPAEQRVAGFLYINMPAVETLGRFDTKGKITPLLAESWQTDPQNKTITLKLKQGIKFHDDTDFNAEAVKWNIEQYQLAKRGEVNGIQSMDVIDANTLRLNLVAWDHTLLESIAYFVQMVSPTAFTKNGKEWAIRNPVGTGPFKLGGWEKDVSIKWKKNDLYWQKGKPYLDAVEYSLISDRNTAANVLKTGGADVLMQTLPELFQEFEKSGKYTIQMNDQSYGALGVGLMFDSVNPDSPFANVKVRQAVIHAVDTEAIIKSVYMGFGTSLQQWNISGTWSYNPDVKGFPYNPEKAKQLLAEAGLPNGFKTKIHVVSPSPGVNLMTAIQTYLAKVGIEVQIINVDNAKWAALAGDKWDGMIWFPMSLSPSTTIQMNRLFGKNGALYGKNTIHPDKVEKLLADAKAAPDTESSKKTVQELQKAIFEESAMAFPVFRLKDGVIMQPTVQNLGMWTMNGFDWTPENVWKKN